MIVAPTAFPINVLAMLLRPDLLLVFPRSIVSLVSQFTVSRIFKKTQKKNPRRKIRGIWKMPHSWLASLPRFPTSQGAGFEPKKTPAFQRHFKTVLCTVLWAVLCPVLSSVPSAFSLNDLRLLSRPDLLLLSSRNNAGSLRRRRYQHSRRY
jgi:hypothetical protein